MVELPLGQFHEHARSWRMQSGDKLRSRGVKICAYAERRLTLRLSERSPAIFQKWRMMRHKKRALRAGLFVVVAATALMTALATPAAIGWAQALTVANALEVPGGSVYVPVQQRPTLRPPRLRLSQSMGERRQRPNALRGLMTPGFGFQRGCQRPPQIRTQLKRQGWWDFHGLRRSGENVAVRARRPNGTVYQLTIERCTGRVLKARPVEEGRGLRLWAR